MKYNLEGKVFRSVANTTNGDVGGDTLFYYRQKGELVSADYFGGTIVSGHLIAQVLKNGQLDMRYHHLNNKGELMLGKCLSTPELMANGRLKFKEAWQWLTGNMSSGYSEIEEVQDAHLYAPADPPQSIPPPPRSAEIQRRASDGRAAGVPLSWHVRRKHNPVITIRPCLETDLPSCGVLLQEIYAEPPYEEGWAESRATAYLEAFFRISADGALVATGNEGKVIGAVFGFSYPWHTDSVFFIQELFVARQYRSKGIAGDLVRQVVEKNIGDSHVALIVREGTIAAKFYEKLGLSKSTQYELRSGKPRV